jgi:hypothetical protein
MATPLLVALVAIAVTDVVFALDSIPAVFGVTRDLFVVFTSNAFAVLGLRALYFLLAGSADRFVYLKPGIALLLVFIGVKMLLYDVVHMPVWVSLVVIAVVAGAAIGASMWRDRRQRRLGEQDPGRDEPYPAAESRPQLSRAARCVRERARQPAGRLPALVRGAMFSPLDGLPVLPRTIVIALGVATAGSADPHPCSWRARRPGFPR